MQFSQIGNFELSLVSFLQTQQRSRAEEIITLPFSHSNLISVSDVNPSSFLYCMGITILPKWSILLFFTSIFPSFVLTSSECQHNNIIMLKSFCQSLNVKKEDKMFKNKGQNGKNNICGERIAEIRRNAIPKTSQRMLAEKLQLAGLDVDKNAIQKIESGQRFVTDIELKVIAKVLNIHYTDLLD